MRALEWKFGQTYLISPCLLLRNPESIKTHTYRCPGSKSPLCPVNTRYGSLGFRTIWMGRTCCYFTVLYMKYMREKREIKTSQMFQLNRLFFNVIMNNTVSFTPVTSMLVCWWLFSWHPLGESTKLGTSTRRASYAEPSVDFWLIGNSTTGIPITICHLCVLKLDIFEAKSESSLRVLVQTHICKAAT